MLLTLLIGLFTISFQFFQAQDLLSKVRDNDLNAKRN